MGLDTTHDCWHGAYSSFKSFRDEVAVAAKEHFDYVPNYEGHPMRAFMGWWDDEHPYGHVLDVFFVHSDCDGYIFPHDAEELIPALDTLVGYLDEGTEWWRPRERLRRFIAGLRDAADHWEVVGFH